VKAGIVSALVVGTKGTERDEFGPGFVFQPVVKEVAVLSQDHQTIGCSIDGRRGATVYRSTKRHLGVRCLED
jgi:hypothetical protein